MVTSSPPTSAPGTDKTGMDLRRILPEIRCQSCLSPGSEPTPRGGFSPLDSVPGFASDTLESMTQQPSPKIQLINTSEYRENYANSVQIRVNLWDFFLMFGRVNQTAADNVAIHNFQGVYLSPQQAKALLNILQQNVTQYETAFGEIKLEPHADGGIVQ